MSIFSPITRRSWSVRILLGVIYCFLLAGASTMLLPLVITVAGSMAGTYDLENISFYPKFLFSERALWSRYLDARYGGAIENFKMAWSEPKLDFYDTPYPPIGASVDSVRLWEEFLAAHGPLTDRDAGLAFTRGTTREAAFENRAFRQWLLKEYGGNLELLNADLLLEIAQTTAILPPLQSRIVVPQVDAPFQRKFSEYLKTVPNSHRLPWDVGGFYRAVYLPRVYGEDIGAFNKAAGTAYRSYGEVPFSSAQSGGDSEPWLRFVQEVLSPAFVELTPDGEIALQASGLTRTTFIRTMVIPEHLRVRSIDTAFAEWAAQRGIVDARIPHSALDWLTFKKEKAFWRWQFAMQNYVYVIDEVLIQGNGVRNTIILVGLTVFGALTVNPLAAYALSRFRLRQGYQVLLFFLATIAFPAEVAMIPNFLQIKQFGLLNTFGALVLPGLVNGFSIFLLKGFFDSLPRELYEAADIDGANEWQIFWGFTMNLSRPILAVIGLNAFISAYSAFFFALILAPDQGMWTLMVWIYQLRQTAGPSIIYASLLITALPTLAVYLCAQNVILRGIVVPTEK